VVWRLFQKRPAAPARDQAWWREADALAESPDAAAIERLAGRPAGVSLDETEMMEEMIEGLRQVLAIASAASLPAVVTQHRVIGADACHLVAPATLLADAATPGKLLLTSSRLIFAGAGVQNWPWHRLRQVERIDRNLIIGTGGDSGARFQCNSYGDAIAARYIARALMTRR
jgi:hypothetical protein